MEKGHGATSPITSAQAQVLACLRDAGRMLTLAELTARTGLHENTARGHLDQLVQQERVTRFPVRREGRGRPAWGYLARESEYAALALALARGLATEDLPGTGADDSAARARAVRGGRSWGEQLAAQVAPDDVTTPRETLLRALEHTGFSPEDDGDVVRLRACPLIDAARAHPEVVCAAHLGLVEGVLGGAGATLRPFAEPGACHLDLP